MQPFLGFHAFHTASRITFITPLRKQTECFNQLMLAPRVTTALSRAAFADKTTERRCPRVYGAIPLLRRKLGALRDLERRTEHALVPADSITAIVARFPVKIQKALYRCLAIVISVYFYPRSLAVQLPGTCNPMLLSGSWQG